MKTLALALIIGLLACAAASNALATSHSLPNKIPYAQTQPDSSSQRASTNLAQWFEEHPALTGLLGAMIGALVALVAVFVSRQTKKSAHTARAGEITAEREAEPELQKQAKTLAKAGKRGELEAEQEIQIEAEDESERRYLNGVLEEYG